MSDTEIMVSVIVLTYNHERYIRQALDSILMQEVDFRYEILVGDDASTDSTPQILMEYQKKYPDVFKVELRENNIGGTKNAYFLLQQATGIYLATLEGDDYWTDENKLQVQVNFLEDNHEYVACTHRFTVVDENNKRLKNQKISWVKQKKIFSLIDFEGLYLPGQPSTFVRRNIFLDKTKDYSIIYKAHRMIGDRTFILIFLLQGNFYFIDENMSCYRRSSNGNNSITDTLYNKNHCMAFEDYQLTCELEVYANHHSDKKIKFDKRKKNCFCSAMVHSIKTRSYKNMLIAIRIAKTEKKMWSYFLYFPLYPFFK